MYLLYKLNKKYILVVFSFKKIILISILELESYEKYNYLGKWMLRYIIFFIVLKKYVNKVKYFLILLGLESIWEF